MVVGYILGGIVLYCGLMLVFICFLRRRGFNAMVALYRARWYSLPVSSKLRLLTDDRIDPRPYNVDSLTSEDSMNQAFELILREFWRIFRHKSDCDRELIRAKLEALFH